MQPHAKGFETPPDVSETSETWPCPLMVQLLMKQANTKTKSLTHRSAKNQIGRGVRLIVLAFAWWSAG